MSQFAFVYRSAPPASLSPQQMQERMQRWQAWFKDVEKRGHLAHYGYPLEPKGGGVVKDKNGSVTDGPYAETKDIILGFSIIEASDFEQAVALAKTHPIYEQGGMIEVRPVRKM